MLGLVDRLEAAGIRGHQSFAGSEGARPDTGLMLCNCPGVFLTLDPFVEPERQLESAYSGGPLALFGRLPPPGSFSWAAAAGKGEEERRGEDLRASVRDWPGRDGRLRRERGLRLGFTFRKPSRP